MKKKFKINGAAYFPVHKGLDIDIILFVLLFLISPIVFGLYFYQSKPWIWLIIFFALGGPTIKIINDFLLKKKNRRTFLEGFSISFEEDAIIQKIPNLKSSFFNSQSLPIIKRINYDEVLSIKKTANNSFIILEKGTPLNYIAIPAQMENYEALALELQEIQPVKIFNIDASIEAEQTFTVPKTGYKTFRFRFLSRLIPMGSIIFLLMIFLLEYSSEDDINWGLLGGLLGFGSIALIWGFSKMLKKYKLMFNDYRFTIFEQFVIEEYKGFIAVIPIDKISEIKKSSEGIIRILEDKSINYKNFGQNIIIPAQISKKELLERKLSEIQSII